MSGHKHFAWHFNIFTAHEQTPQKPPEFCTSLGTSCAKFRKHSIKRFKNTLTCHTIAYFTSNRGEAFVSSVPVVTVLVEAPQWGAADAEIKAPSGENTEFKCSPFEAWSRSVYSHTCYANCQGFLPRLFLPSRSIQPSKLVSWCFEPSQPQRITSGLNTNFTLTPSYSFHKSS